MTTQSSNTTPLNRRKVFSIGAALVVAGISPALVLPLEKSSEGDEARIEVLKKVHQILGRALADSRLHIETTNRKQSAGTFTVRLEGEDYLQFLSAVLVGVVFAGLKTPEEVVAIFDNNIGQPKARTIA